jgi:hypothetical protein
MWSEDWIFEETWQAAQLTHEIIEIDPDEFVRLMSSGVPTPISNDIKHLYLLWRRFSSKGALKSLEELRILVFDAEGQIEDRPDSSVLKLALQEFKGSAREQIIKWKLDLREN